MEETKHEKISVENPFQKWAITFDLIYENLHVSGMNPWQNWASYKRREAHWKRDISWGHRQFCECEDWTKHIKWSTGEGVSTKGENPGTGGSTENGGNQDGGGDTENGAGTIIIQR
uniref:ORF2 n=1 Tax=Torque teno Arctocephalus gazella virus 1 TaxID=2249932 RepID=A0A2Z4N3I0_9VIRU|nr:ORF2 [Torque teno Arctocephalus gazella virus 1]